ncbi:MAG: diphosphate--fructose-6-phosphate 1-phosphotransferase [Acidobacteriota bacterium]
MGAGNLVVIQAGGPTAVVNASLYAVLDSERRQKTSGRIFGSRNGLQGLIRGDLVDLGFLTSSQLELLRHSPGAMLGSSRVKPSEAELTGILRDLRERDIHQALFIGGNGTMHAALMISRFCKQANYEMQVVGIPKTVDNDINGTDRCPGYGSAARYVAQSTRDLGMDVRALAQPVSVLETMGRHVGWLAAASVMAKRSAQDAPHMVYIPEVPFEMDVFLTDLDTTLRKQNWAIVVVSEGLRDSAGRPVYETSEASQRDEFNRALPGGVGHFLAETVTRRLKIRCRDEKPGLLGRASILHVSPQDRMDAELVGRVAHEALAAGCDEQMVALMPLRSGEPATTKLIPLEAVSGPDRAIPREWLGKGNPPTNHHFAEYLRPFIGELLEYEDVFDRSESYENA